MVDVKARTKELFDGGYNCAESVLLATAEAAGLKSEVLPRIATAFGGGMSRTKSTCGAICGALMAIGLAFGRDNADEDRAPSYGPGSRLVEDVRREFGSDNCFGLTGLDFSTNEGQEEYKKRVHETVCVKVAEFAAARAAELIEEQRRQG